MLRPDLYAIQVERRAAELEDAIRTDERNKIIKLLDRLCECDGTDDGWNYCYYHRAIDEIKGEIIAAPKD